MRAVQPTSDRRHHERVKVRGAVTLFPARGEVHGRAISVSDGILEVRCDLGIQLEDLAHDVVKIEMRLDDAAGSRLLLHGRVVHVRRGTQSLVIEIAGLPLPLAARIAAQTGREHASRIEVLVLDRDHARGALIAEAFRREGCDVAEADRARSALDALGLAPPTTSLVVVADAECDVDGVCLADYLETARVDTLVVAVGDPAQWTPAAPAPLVDDASPLRSPVAALLGRSLVVLLPRDARPAFLADAVARPYTNG